MKINLIRDYKPEATIGILQDENGSRICHTLERPNRNNQRDNINTPQNESSCIPEGIYLCKRYSSPKHPNTWEITGVPERSKILFHPANVINELLGCIATATVIQDMNPNNSTSIASENRWYASQSKDSFKKFVEIIGDQDFTLRITSLQTLCDPIPAY